MKLTNTNNTNNSNTNNTNNSNTSNTSNTNTSNTSTSLNIKYVLFDWDGTLGISGTREDFIQAKTKEEKLKFLQPHVFEALNTLYQQGIYMGILSNTHIEGSSIREAMNVADLTKFFPIQVYTSDPGIPCEKPCKKLFDIAFDMIQKEYSDININNILYVGNSYLHDICGAWNASMNTAYIVNENLLKYYIASMLPIPDFVLFTMKDLMIDLKYQTFYN